MHPIAGNVARKRRSAFWRRCRHFCFFHPINGGGGGLGSPMFVPGPALGLGSLKRQETRGWFLTTRVFWHLECPQCLETPQGVPLDSLGVGAIEFGHIIVPDPSPTSPGSTEARSGGGGGVFAFSDWISAAWGPGGSPLFVPCSTISLQGLKEVIIAGGQKPPPCFRTFCASGVNGGMGQCIGMINEHVADEEAAEKHFPVPATSLEALSAIRRRCQAMDTAWE